MRERTATIGVRFNDSCDRHFTDRVIVQLSHLIYKKFELTKTKRFADRGVRAGRCKLQPTLRKGTSGIGRHSESR